MTGRRVLVVRVGAMGDVLHALPAVAALRQRWPEAAIDWVVDPRWAPLLVDAYGVGPIVGRAHLAETRLWSRAPASAATARSVLALRRALRAGNYDHVVDMQGTLRSAVIGRLAGGNAVAGFNDPREAVARLLYRKRLNRRGAHVVDQGASLLGEALSIYLQPVAPPLPTDPAAEAWAEQMVTRFESGRRIALLAPTAGWGAKQWPTQRFGAVAAALAQEGWAVLVNAASEQDSVCQGVVEASGGSATLVASTMAQLIALVRRISLMVGGDSGPVHLAAAVGIPVVALYGPTDPARNGPWGPGPKALLRDPSSVTSHKRVPTVEAGLLQISAEQVLAAVRSLAER